MSDVAFVSRTARPSSVVTRYRVRYRDESGRQHCETKMRLVDAERRKAEIEVALAGGTWRDPRRGEMRLHEWAELWLPTRHDLRPTTWARLETTMQKQVLPFSATRPFARSRMRASDNGSQSPASGLSAATTRKAVFALRQCLDAAIADNRLQFNPATAVPLPTERQKPRAIYRRARLSASWMRCLLSIAPSCWSGRTPDFGGEKLQGCGRRDIDPMRSRIRITSTAVELRGQVTLDNEPKTTRSKRSVPVARSVMRRLEDHLSEFVDSTADALVFTAPAGGPLFRSWGRNVLRPAVLRAGLANITFHGLRHSFVAIMVAAGCNVREVSEWAGHNSVAFTLTRYGGLFEDNTDAAIDRLDALLGDKVTGAVSQHHPAS